MEVEETLHLYTNAQKTSVDFWIPRGKPLQPMQHFVDYELAIQTVFPSTRNPDTVRVLCISPDAPEESTCITCSKS